MTKEETIKAFAHIIFDAAKMGYIPFDTDDELCAMNIARKKIEELLPSLPSNPDEAAEEYMQGEIDTCVDYFDETGQPLCFMSGIKEYFKAGAEWMAGQGVSIDATVTNYDDGLGLDMPDEDILSGHFESGDKVIVQIRKK